MAKMQKKVLIFVILLSQFCAILGQDNVQIVERQEPEETTTVAESETTTAAESETTTAAESETTTAAESETTTTSESEANATATQAPDPATTSELNPNSTTSEEQCADLNCDNGGTAFANSSGVCQCRCTANYQGTFCDKQRNLIQYAMTFTLQSNSTFNESVQKFREVLSDFFNDVICPNRTYLENTCCTQNTVEQTTGFDDLVFLRPTTEDQHVLGRYEITEESGQEKTYKFCYYITVDPNNTFCRHAYESNGERRKRQADMTEGQPMPQDDIFEVLDENREEFETLLETAGVPLGSFERSELEPRPDTTTATPPETTTATPTETPEPCNSLPDEPDLCAPPPPPPCYDPAPCDNNGPSDCLSSPCNNNNYP